MHTAIVRSRKGVYGFGADFAKFKSNFNSKQSRNSVDSERLSWSSMFLVLVSECPRRREREMGTESIILPRNSQKFIHLFNLFIYSLTPNHFSEILLFKYTINVRHFFLIKHIFTFFCFFSLEDNIALSLSIAQVSLNINPLKSFPFTGLQFEIVIQVPQCSAIYFRFHS